MTEALIPLTLADLDLRRSASTLGDREARYLVDLYYSMQDQRKRCANQMLALGAGNEPHAMIQWSTDTFLTVEKSIKGAMESYALAQRPGAWAMSIRGIGPIIAAGLLAHIQMAPWRCVQRTGPKDGCTPEAPHGPGCAPRFTRTAGAVWRYAGLDPTSKWEKGKVRPWNARLKRLSWIIGDMFVKHRNHPSDFYGKLYDQRKVLELERNDAGNFADTARRTLEERAIKDKKLKTTYESGKLPLGRLELRARRWAVKIFLAHYHHVAYECYFGEAPPKPYVIAHLNHAGMIEVPNWP